MDKPTTVAEAFTYVNSRYTFTDATYCTLKKLEGDERISFALDHSLKHLMKSINQVRRSEFVHASPRDDQFYKQFFTKVMMNLLKIAEIAGFTAEEFAALTPVAVDHPFSRIVENMMQEIATETESFDHGEPLRPEMIKHSVAVAWQYILYTFSKRSDITLSEALSYIPLYMKSQ